MIFKGYLFSNMTYPPRLLHLLNLPANSESPRFPEIMPARVKSANRPSPTTGKNPSKEEPAYVNDPTDQRRAGSILITEAQTEEKRLQEINYIASVIDDEELVREAKYGNYKRGISPCSAAELAYKAVRKRAKDKIYEDIDTGVNAVKKAHRGISQG